MTTAVISGKSRIDMFRTRSKPVDLDEVLLKMGRLEAEVETLQLKWTGTRDEIKRLVNRLEKRDERADKKAAAAVEIEIPIDKDATPAERVDDITTRVLARRNRHVLPG